MLSPPEVFDQAFAGPQRECHDTDRGCLVRAVPEYARVAHIKVGHVVGLPVADPTRYVRFTYRRTYFTGLISEVLVAPRVGGGKHSFCKSQKV